ncbi:hypothetical protein WJX73_007673 [Symbiochloris irregularis]|uniref:Calcineurin-like phosphoesterase domain-containing protein n=1 Tax=Symbiochloris irregularis TaxID=706552 RepID=A0AAW1PSE3_9CHLO
MSPRKRARVQSAAKGCVRLAIVGDVHGQYGPEDEAAIRSLGVDATLFVGDFGEEDVELVQQIASGDTPRFTILGNHDAWYSLTTLRPDFKGVQSQLDALGQQHIGYSSCTVPAANGPGCTVVGARPFSRGGDKWEKVAFFYKQLYEVESMEASAARVSDTVLKASQQGLPLVLMSHNGPTGLGELSHSICGIDWTRDAGDHGDPDLREALDDVHNKGSSIALVVFGHMHHKLNHRHGDGALRSMAVIDPATGTVYINAAVVPRVRPRASGEAVTCRHFVVC